MFAIHMSNKDLFGDYIIVTNVTNPIFYSFMNLLNVPCQIRWSTKTISTLVTFVFIYFPFVDIFHVTCKKNPIGEKAKCLIGGNTSI